MSSSDERGIPTDIAPERRAYQDFRGRIGRTLAESESWWPERATSPAGAPNVVVVMCDDLGFSDVGCFGSEIDTPNIDLLAQEGLRYSNFHVTPMCSPTRAALLTGRNAHAAGVGYVAHADPGFPSLAMELGDDVPTLAETLRDAGYATMAVGKWHLCKDNDDHDGAPMQSWPLQRGFERFYGFLGGMTDLHNPPAILRGNEQVSPDEYPPGYYFTDDITDEAIRMLKSVKASDPTKPAFLYVAHGAVHAPLHAKPVDIEKYRGTYSQGWDALRESRFAKQLHLGVIRDGTRLAPRNTEEGDNVVAWDSLTADEQMVFARYMEVYAAMVDSVDQSLGRIRKTLEDLGEWDNTIVLFTSDNGASREGEADGTMQYFDALRRFHDKGVRTDGFARDLETIDLVGGPRSMPHYPRGWAMASNTPFRLYKVNTHAGGHSVPAVMSWPARLREFGGGIRRQYVHVTDLFPTLLELIGIANPTHRQGVPLKPEDGSSFAQTMLDAEAPHERGGQIYEMFGHRGYYEDGWEIVSRHIPLTPFDDAEYELYHLDEDPTECRNLAAEHPDKVAELSKRWEQAAWENQVFPLDEGSGLKRALRPQREERLSLPVRILPGTPTLERYRSAQLVALRSYHIVVEVDFHPGDRGTLVAHGGQSSGYSLYIDNDRVTYLHNAYGTVHRITSEPLNPGRQELTIDVCAHDASTLTVHLDVAGECAGELSSVSSMAGQALFQGIDIGIDRRSPVSWDRHITDGTFGYTGTLIAVQYLPGTPLRNIGTDAVARLRAMALAAE
ncbi:arylsulfatase [Rhodococcus sp. ARC_M6]|uniref:arylsulfatase n=1 Tax=Rhodococcus sp. ARC_M6 TaxID=2928852 RepID=UPI001FB56700|nr:arylsulfatase [Rhodococcus sp. ARC_M6]MCJ0903694.1 arylsulfatase [Rhodococcus sp. ARC_M6]